MSRVLRFVCFAHVPSVFHSLNGRIGVAGEVMAKLTEMNHAATL